MQSVTERLPRFMRRKRPKIPMDAAGQRRSDLRWAIAGMTGIIIMVVVIGVMYIAKGDETVYSAQMPEAGPVRVGDEVRVAGITTGTVKSLTLEPGHVTMEFSVDNDVFIGNETTLDIRMLTVVGGNYVAVEPAGIEPLGSATIPPDRVHLPYSLTRLFQDAIEPLEEIDGSIVRENFATLASSIEASPESFSTLLTAVEDIVEILDKQNSDVSRALSVASEYLTALDTNKEVLARLIVTLDLLITLVENDGARVAQSLTDLAAIVEAAAPLGQQWNESGGAGIQPLDDAITQLTQLGTGLDSLLAALRDLDQQLQPLLSREGGLEIDQSARTIIAPQLCVPVPGRTC